MSMTDKPTSAANHTAGAASKAPASRPTTEQELQRSFYRAANEDDDGYDPYSDRPAAPEPLFERDPWS